MELGRHLLGRPKARAVAGLASAAIALPSVDGLQGSGFEREAAEQQHQPTPKERGRKKPELGQHAGRAMDLLSKLRRHRCLRWGSRLQRSPPLAA